MLFAGEEEEGRFRLSVFIFVSPEVLVEGVVV